MFRRNLRMLTVVAACTSLGSTAYFVRVARAAPGDVVDLEASTDATDKTPPTSTTGTSTKTSPITTPTEAKSAKADTEGKNAAKDTAAAEKLNLRAGERVGGEARGKAQVLGMALQEGPRGQVKVVDVAMNSPAFDAGVMKGDEILAFQGFRGDSYRKWIDGIRRLTTDTAAGLKIPVVVSRDGKQLGVQIEVQEKVVRTTPPRGLAPIGSPVIPPGIGPAMPATEGVSGAPVVAGGANNVVVGGGAFGEFFGGPTAGVSERAVAQIVRLGGPTPTPPAAAGEAPPTSAVGATATPRNGGVHIGMAGFRDDPTGLLVMVDVGALPAGKYNVGISDPSVIGGATVGGAPAPGVSVPAPTQPAQPDSTNPLPPATRQPQGSLPQGSSKLIPRAVLAQVATSTESATVADALATQPNSGGSETRPATLPAGPSDVDGGQPANSATHKNSPPDDVGSTLNHIGTLTVNESGTGRLQQKVETVQVRNVVGQAIVIYSPSSSPKNPAAQLNRTDPQRSATTPSSAVGEEAAPGAPPSAQVPVAAGIIQLVTDRRPPAAARPQAAQSPAGGNTPIQQPAAATPPVEQNIVR